MGRRRREEHEEHENHERWLVTYADMVTLLMVLFIVMFAMSQVDERKFNELRAGLAAGFGTSESILDGSDALLSEPGTQAVRPVKPAQFSASSGTEDDLAQQAVARHEQDQAARRYAEARAEAERLLTILAEVRRVLKAAGLEQDVRSSIDDRGLVLSLVSKHVVFQANLADLSPRGRQVLDAIAPVLRDLPDPLGVDGHTNQVPVQPKYYPTDWELSAARAVTVLRYLNENARIPNGRMVASAYGHERPLVDPKKAGSQRVNKRVDIVVVSRLEPESRELLGDVIDDQGGI